MSKVHVETLRECVNTILGNPKVMERKFTETVELQIGLKAYNTQTDKRFSGAIKLPYLARPRLSVCIFGDTTVIRLALLACPSGMWRC